MNTTKPAVAQKEEQPSPVKHVDTEPIAKVAPAQAKDVPAQAKDV